MAKLKDEPNMGDNNLGIRYYPSRYGVLAHFEADRHIGRSLERYGEWAQAEIAELLPRIPTGGTVLDIGAHIGTHTLPFALKVGETGTVVAIEGQPEVASLLSASIVFNRLYDRVSVLGALVSDSETLVHHVFKKPDAVGNVGSVSFANASDARSKSDAPGLRTQIPTIRLDSMNLSRCDLIKIDVEGMELDVFKGATELITEFQPVIYYEQSSEKNFAEIRSLLTTLGYRLFYHVSNPFNVNNFLGCTENFFDGHVEVNILALPEGCDQLPPQELEILSDTYEPTIPTLEEGLKGEYVNNIPSEPPQLDSGQSKIASVIVDGFVREARRFEKRVTELNKELKASASNISGLERDLIESKRQRDELGQRAIDAEKRIAENHEQLQANSKNLFRVEQEKSRLTARLASETDLLTRISRQLNYQTKCALELETAQQARSSPHVRSEPSAPLPDCLGKDAEILGGTSRSTRADRALILRSSLFDSDWYRKQVERRFGIAPKSARSLMNHYLTLGWRRGLDPHPMFCTRWYYYTHRDVQASNTCPLLHFLKHGIYENRDPHPLVSVVWYKDQNPDIGGIPPVVHMLADGLSEQRDPHPLFSSAFYLQENDDVADFDGGVFLHFLKHGHTEGRSPHPFFDADWYSAQYRGLPKYHDNSLCDLVMSALHSERDPNPLFWSKWYRQRIPALSQSIQSSALYHVALGEHLGENPNPLFHTKWYRQEADLAPTEFGIAHFRSKGAANGLSPNPLFDPNWVSSQSGSPIGNCFEKYLHGLLDVDPHPAFDSAFYVQRTKFRPSTDHSTPLSHYFAGTHDATSSPNRYFDQAYYMEKYPSVLLDGHDPFVHYVCFGEKLGWTPNQYFWPSWYRDSHPKECEHFSGALAAFQQIGAQRLHDPSPLFHSAWVCHTSNLVELGHAAHLSYEMTSSEGEDTNPFFDSDWYRSQYLDGDPEQVPILHYFEHGWKLGYKPNYIFDVEFYNDLALIRDENPLQHFCEIGVKQGLTFSPLLDPTWYQESVLEATDYPGGPLAHFLRVGDVYDYSPSPLFDASYYRQRHPDIRDLNCSAFRHYVEFGEGENRRPNSDFDPGWYKTEYGITDHERPVLAHFAGYGDFQGFFPCGDMETSSALIAAPNSYSPNVSDMAPRTFDLGSPTSRNFLIVFGKSAEFSDNKRQIESAIETHDCIWITDDPKVVSKLADRPRHYLTRLLSTETMEGRLLYSLGRCRGLLHLALTTARELAFRPDCATITLAPANANLNENGGWDVDPKLLEQLGIADITDLEQRLQLSPTMTNVHLIDTMIERLLHSDRLSGDEADWTFGKYPDGTLIKPMHRELYKANTVLARRFPDPYDDPASMYLGNWMRAAIGESAGYDVLSKLTVPNSLVSKLMRA